ncbi:MAG: hypothetical protein KA973_19075 [Candidatus Microthrix sp.]|nr:hypothetical protein [Candidatus Microthrix sp.]
MNHAEYARVKRLHRAHPDWPLAACITRAEDEADEYAADSRLAALGASGRSAPTARATPVAAPSPVATPRATESDVSAWMAGVSW